MIANVKNLKKIDWQLFLERKNAIFYASIYNRADGHISLEVTGFRFHHQIRWCENGLIKSWKPKKEIAKAKEYFFIVIEKESHKIKEWEKQGKEYLKQEQELIRRFNLIKTKEIQKNYEQIIKECEYLFVYATVIPNRILTAIEFNAQEKKFKDIVDVFQVMKKTSRVALHELVFEKIWKAAAEVSGWNNPMDFSFFTVTELGNLFQNKEYPDKEEIKKRKKGCAIYFGDDDQEVFFYEKNILQKIGIKEENIEATEIKGQIACRGIVQGKVCILNRIGDMKKFEEGDIIVSINTTPSLMPAILKCKAIVADEGGLISHAAIIARELKKPCIIGTKTATKIFKDGDIVEVDAEKGIVRKVK